MASASRYSNVAILFHWVIAFLILGQIVGGLYMTGLSDDQQAERIELYQLHKSFGITILLLSLLRLGWRLTHKPPALPGGMKSWEMTLAKVTHISFYALMIGVPLGGWALVSASPFASSVPTYLFGVIPWPHLPFFEGIENRGALAEQISQVHGFFALTTLALFGLHIVAVMKHMFVDDDDLILRMLPHGTEK